MGREAAGWDPPGPPILPSPLPPFLRVNPFPAPPPARLGLLNAFAEPVAGAQPGAFVAERTAQGRGWGCRADCFLGSRHRRQEGWPQPPNRNFWSLAAKSLVPHSSPNSFNSRITAASPTLVKPEGHPRRHNPPQALPPPTQKPTSSSSGKFKGPF